MTRNSTLVVCVLVLGLQSEGCKPAADQAAAAATCAAGWASWVSPDSLVDICTPPGFNPGSTVIRGGYTWKRPTATPGDSDWVAVAIVADSTNYDTWPFPLASVPGCTTDCYSVDSSVVHADTISGAVARLETGLVSGGDEQARRAPRLVGGWITPQRTRILVVGAAEHGATLDTLRMALRTLHVRVP